MRSSIDIIILIIIIFFTNSIKINAQLTLDSCQQKAKRNYPLVASYNILEQSKDYSLSNAKKNYLPQLSINAIGGIIEGLPDVGNTETNNGQLILMTQLTQPIWDGGITKGQKAIIEAEHQIKINEINEVFYKLNDRINEIYFSILLFEAKINSIESLNIILEAQKNSIKAAIDNEMALFTDIQEIEIVLLENKQRLSEVSAIKGQFTNILSQFIGEPISDSEIFLKPRNKTWASNDSILRPELFTFQSKIQKIEAQKLLNKSSLYPKLGLTAVGINLIPERGIGPAAINNLFVGGLSVSWNINGLLKNGTKTKILNLGTEQINIQKKQFLFNTNLAEKTDQAQLNKYQDLIDQSTEILNLQKSIVSSYQAKYNNGSLTITDLLKKIETVNLAETQLQINQLSYLKIVYHYNYTTGK